MLGRVEVPAAITDNPVYRQRVQDANRFLTEALAEEEKPTTVRWELIHGSPDDPIFLVSLEDPNEETSTSLQAFDFKDFDRLRGLMYHLYGKLLRIRIRKNVRELQASLANGASE